jgi:hypothetical protein
MKKTYIMPQTEVEVMELEDGLMLEISTTGAESDLDVLAPEDENLNIWSDDDISL